MTQALEELVGRLEQIAQVLGNRGNASPATHIAEDAAEAAQAIRSLSADKARLEEALRPFAALYEQVERDHGPHWFPADGGPMRAALSYPVAKAPIRWSDFARAALALNGGGGE